LEDVHQSYEDRRWLTMVVALNLTEREIPGKRGKTQPIKGGSSFVYGMPIF